MTNVRILHGKLVTLRPLVFTDYSAFRSVRLQNLAWLTQWEPYPLGGEPAHDETLFALRCKNRWSQWEHDNGYAFGVFVGNQFVGEVNCNNVMRGSIQQADIGYWIGEEFAGNGYIPDAVLTVSGFAFSYLRLHRLQIAIIPRNTPSLRVVEKLGWREEGYAQRYLQINGVWEDHRIFACTIEEWLDAP